MNIASTARFLKPVYLSIMTRNFGKSCLFYWMFQTIGSILCEAGQSCLPCGILGLIYCLINPNAILLVSERECQRGEDSMNEPIHKRTIALCVCLSVCVYQFRMRMAVMKRFGIQGNPCIGTYVRTHARTRTHDIYRCIYFFFFCC